VRGECVAVQEIAEWLDKLGMPEYGERFAENDIDGSVLPHLTDQSLKELGVWLPPFSNETKLIFMYSTLEIRTFHQEDQTLGGFAPPQICHESDHDLYLK
jgi:hypothetical protein